MKVISITINKSAFLVEKVKVKNKNNVDNGQVINNTFYYTEKYIKKHNEEVKELLSNKSVDKVVYKDFDSFFALFSLVNVTNINFNVKKALSNRVMDTLIQDNNLRILECYFMPSDYVHQFAIKNISIKFNNDMFFSSEFVRDNELKNMKHIYYKRNVKFYREEDVKNNLESFLSVNSHLEKIHLYFYSDDVITFIVDKLNNNNFNETSIFIHQNEEDIKEISNSTSFLKKVNKKFSENGNREIKIIYSDEYFKENIFKQLTLNGLKMCMVILLYLGVVFTVSQKYHEYLAILNIRKLESTLANDINKIIIDDIDDTEINVPVIEEPSVPNDEQEEQPKEYINYYANIPTSFDRLLEINSDVVGWLQVNNTKINYPVTQSKDNIYYLEHDIYNKEIITGWIYMDYRNNRDELDDNTIIYGHNLISGYMFGDLILAGEKWWYNNPQNQIITFNTLGKEMKWRIFSVYRTDYTTDYLKTNFYNDEQFMEFVNLIKGRSINDFNVNVKPGDKILTLSTCTGSNDRRLAIHAVLI